WPRRRQQPLQGPPHPWPHARPDPTRVRPRPRAQTRRRRRRRRPSSSTAGPVASSPCPEPARAGLGPHLPPPARSNRGRPLGGAPSSPAPALEKDREVSFAVTSPKPDKFVPPHLRPGFAGREKRPGPDIQKQGGFRGGEPVPRQQGYYGSPGRYGEDGRPKSGGYDAVRTGGQADLNRASSFGSRPSSSG
ncbi:translation initiation factor IF-2, partial [Eucalyptus grandis]|uniref:translation initiation factor IF-2 n=1 Tax=Eucalyptus grandis TaxID=71139 RepID=UPI00192EDB19